MHACFGVFVALRQPKINQIDHARLGRSDQEVVRFHIAMNKVLLVHKLEPCYHLIGYHQGGLH